MNYVSAERQCVCDQSDDRYENEEDGADHQEERRADAERPGCHGGTYYICVVSSKHARHIYTSISVVKSYVC